MLTYRTDTILGDVPQDWDRERLRGVLSFHSAGDWGGDSGQVKVNAIRSTNFTESGRLDFGDVAKRFLDAATAALLEPRKNDLLLERSGGGPEQPVGRIGFVRENLPGHAFSNFIHLLRPDPTKIEPDFLGWVLHRIQSTGIVVRLEQQTTGMRNLHFRDYLTLRFPKPPGPEQRAIADILDAVDAAIERTRIASEKAQRLKRGLMLQLFQVGFDGNGVARDDGRKGQFCSTPYGRFPVDWQISDVRAEFEIATGFTLGQHRRPQMNPRKYLRVANVQREFVSLDDVSELEAAEREMEGRRLETNDLLIVEGHADPGAIGRCAIVPPDAAGMTFQNHLFRLRSLRLNPLFAMFWLNSTVCRRYWRQKCATSSGLNTINQRKLKRLPVAVPPKPEQEMIADTLQANNDLLSTAELKLTRLLALKRGLMQDLLTGKVRVAAKPKT